jgi:hypothetical protein
LFLFMFQIKICQQILNVSYGFQHTYGGSKWDHHPQFWHHFLVRFWQGFFLYIYIPYTISCLPVSNVSKISVYEICLEIYLCILNSEFYVMYRISLHSMWQITTKHFKVIHWHFVIQIQIQILYWYEIQHRIVISNNTINRHTQNMKQLKTKSW